MGIIGTLLAGCGMVGRRSDMAAVQSALQAAAEAQPEYLRGVVAFQDTRTAGTFMSGVLTLAGEDRDEVAESLLGMLGTVLRTYREQPRVRTAHVRIEAHPDGDRRTRVLARDVVEPANGAVVTTDDLAEHFGQ